MGAAQTPDAAELAEVDAKFAAVAERRQLERERVEHDRVAYRNLWLSHHWPHRYDRCAVVSSRHVCRRCLWFYTTALVTLALGGFGITPWPEAWDAALVWILAIPATADFAMGELGSLKYHPRRQVIVTTLLGLAVGRGFYQELTMMKNPIFWGPVMVFGSIWFAVAVIAWMNNRGQYRDMKESAHTVADH